MSLATQPRAIDFDHAKLQRLGFCQLQSAALPPIDVTELRQQLGLQLQTSLDAEKILTIFFRGIKRLIALDGLTYGHRSSDLHLKMGERAHHFASYTLSSEGEHLGELVFQRSHRFLELELTQIESLLPSLLFPLRNALLYRSATQSALRDPLTNTGNRVAMDQTLAREIELAIRHKGSLSVLMLDIDHFKRVNDMHGHAVGDEVLKAVAGSIKSQLRNVDRVFRFGGEEFFIVLSNTDREAAAMVGERLRQAAQQLTCSPDHPIKLTVSLGGAALLPAESATSLQLRADSALYVAKREGRNRLEMAG
ncbi:MULTISPECIES: GGDEF domain-containing protein [unclassified Pseudomonas]|uniref:GGDEF domain-containing protein n=1 Tax=unclassified Pseudomonas TaxID=196821 RepID=UPI002B22BA55|nr:MULTISPECIES: GGDEF domain-containing protein [unclassified Pseudomonas]MEA9976800.1 GGDEF domain-containing protein [Pseudomonas sp. RTS4]MEB0199295.1 GGDEF domain-containing protein [Pseudomonas sp. 5S4]MEB0246611.1 GGDEF domain-containing protein [Pseudomonas sp. 10S5]